MECIQPSPKRPRRSAISDDGYKSDNIDRLPDDILIEILDRLPMEEAMGTTFLSKRWKNLWKYKRNIELGYGWVYKTGKKVLPSLFKIFDSLENQDLHSISVSLRYHQSMLSKIESLISFASLKNVIELYIDFNGRNDHRVRWRRQHPVVLIPECELRSCLTLSRLSLKSLKLQTLPSSRFRALKELYLESVILNTDSVESITGNCPLSLLCLCNCNPYTDLKIIVAKSSNLHHLIIKEEFLEVLNITELCIRAPNVSVVEFGLALPRKRYEIEGRLNCSEATFRLNQMHRSRQAMRVTSIGICGKFTGNFLGLLKELSKVKKLTLSSWCIQVLTIEVVKLQRPLTFDVIHLILETGLIRWEFRGIAYMLLGCTKLQKLVVVMGAPAELNFNFMENVTYYGNTVKFSNILQELEVVEFRKPLDFNETWEQEDFNEVQFFLGFNFGRLLLWNLKEYAEKLKKVIFATGRSHFETEHFERLGDLSSFQDLDYCKLSQVYGTRKFISRRL